MAVASDNEGFAKSPLQPLISVEKLEQVFDLGKGQQVKAVNQVDLDIYRGETLGLVGESGSGKSTLGRAILQLYQPTSGRIMFHGFDLQQLTRAERLRVRKDMQIIFQDPYASLDPRMKVEDIIGEALDTHGLVKNASQRRERIEELLALVELDASFASRFPHEFSGGQRQRIGIARALAVEPDFIVADEPLSALDVSIQAQIIDLMQKLQEQLGLTYLFIAHDLAVVKQISDRVAVMQHGQIVEIAETNELYDKPLHPYTQQLLSAVPRLDAQFRASDQEIKDAVPASQHVVTLVEVSPGHFVAQ
ncbi:ABC transporter ATP-binding protein [Fundicoccus sp. Sow4_F4]|uniref:ABC transporter ATP-binding protein n=1 Tax=Fundicoccus sp. Sow4_F4 TaxID=3438783 RepID=UPI003F9117A0